MKNKPESLSIIALVWLLGSASPGVNSVAYVSAFSAPATFAVSTEVKQNAQSALFSQGSDLEPSKYVRRKLPRLFRLPKIPTISRKAMRRKNMSKVTASLALSLSILTKAPKSAIAEMPMGVETPVFMAPGNDKISLRPGITKEQIDLELQKRDEMTWGDSLNPATDTLQEDANINSQKKDSTDDFDDDYDFDDDEEDESEASIFSNNIPSSSSSNVMDVSGSSSSKTVDRLSGSAPELTKSAEDVLIKKTVVKIIGPIFAFCFARETIRWRMEQNNVNKGIEIMEQQRQEYLNSKKDEDDDDDGDDDDDDEDDDDDDDEDDEDDDDDDDDDE